jgi:hypothetical protein
VCGLERHRAGAPQPIDRGVDQGGIDLEPGGGRIDQRPARHVAVSSAARLVEDVANPGVEPDFGVLGDPERHRQLVGREKPDAPDVESEAVGILAHLRDRRGPVAFVDARRERG